ncbi:MAG: lysine exporter LysO family protein [Candidatus Korarchaeum sp.]|nr:lysine exporter LysO family protein [Candidatus Korarchaeum sp.]MDW8034962.1 lysine exporter LysO family protein [Candidatus Korarchaeum sp.]
MLSSLLPVVLLISGILLGSVVRLPVAETMASILLYFLLFLVGISLGSERVKANWRDLEIPMITAAGTLVAAAISSLITGLPLKASLSIAAGFGWYTLAGPLVTSLLGAEVGAIAFLSNLLREAISLALHRTIASKLGCNALIACGGAASMDIFLPFIADACGSESSMRSFVSGFVLTLATPLLISFFATYL